MPNYFQLKKKLRTEQMEREKEQADHAAMLREQSKTIADSISEKEDLQHQVVYIHMWIR